MITGLAHLSFTVSDLDRSLRFYRDLMGFKVDFVVERSGPVTEAIVGIVGVKLRIGMLSLNGFLLELIQYLSPAGEKLDLRVNSVGCSHIALYVEELERVYGTLVTKGVSFRSKPNLIRDGPMAGWKVVYMADPDGIILELMQKPNAGLRPQPN
ncbi:MAG: VOC family protein [Thermodesulfobacteriota bacterium]